MGGSTVEKTGSSSATTGSSVFATGSSLSATNSTTESLSTNELQKTVDIHSRARSYYNDEKNLNMSSTSLKDISPAPSDDDDEDSWSISS